MARLSKPSWAAALIAAVAVLVCWPVASAAPVSFGKGDLVRLTRSETLMFQGKTFLGAPKGQEFTVLKHEFRTKTVYVGFVKEDGSLIAVALPEEALEVAPADAWQDLLAATDAFRETRVEDARRLLARAGQSQEFRQIATAINGRITGLQATAARAAGGRQPFLNALQTMRATAEQLQQGGYLCLALALEEGADRIAAAALGQGPVPPSKLDRAELSRRVAISNRSAARARQALALRRLIEASKLVSEGLEAEPNRPDLKRLDETIKKGIADAEDSYKAAESMRRFEKGAVHALSALERGLKYCADHPRLIALKKEMQSSWEERTAPPIGPKLTALAAGGGVKNLEEGRMLYTTRCTECHDLELLDSRTMSSWRSIVAGMARRANVDAQQQERILAYIAAAQGALDAQ